MTRTTSRIPAAARRSSAFTRIGVPLTSTRHFGIFAATSPRRLPRPATRMTADGAVSDDCCRDATSCSVRGILTERKPGSCDDDKRGYDLLGLRDDEAGQAHLLRLS